MTPEEKIESLGLELPKLGPPIATYVRAVQVGDLVFLAGHGPAAEYVGKLGADVTIERGYEAARTVALGLLASLKAEIDALSRVKRIVKLLGMVNATPEFRDHPKVINGASDLLVEVFGDAGRHARSAVGMGSLPNQIPVEIELIVQLHT